MWFVFRVSLPAYRKTVPFHCGAKKPVCQILRRALFLFQPMISDQQDSVPLLSRIALRWRAVRDGYRQLDTATHHAIGVLLKIAVATYFVFCALFLTARYVVWPHIENYKGEIEQIASKAIGNPVSIAGIRAGWDGLNPSLMLDGVVVRDKGGRQALTLPEVSATLSWWSIPTASLRFQQLEISRPNLDIHRDAVGKVYIAGLLFDSGKDNDGKGKGADWVLSQKEIVIRDGRLRWTDEMRKAPELALEDVRMVLQNGWYHHRLMLTAKPPASMAAPLDVRADFVHPYFSSRISDVSQWKGVLFADLQNTDLTAWKAYFDYPFEISKGFGSVQAWLTLDGARVLDFTADLALSNVSTRLRKDLEQLNLIEISGRVSAREDYSPDQGEGKPTFGAQGHSVALTDLSLKTQDGLVLPKTTIMEEFLPSRGGAPSKTTIRTKQLDLPTISDFSKYLPLTVDQRKMLADFTPSGQLKNFSVVWQGNYPELVSYQVSGDFSGLSLKAQAPRAARPASGKSPAQAAIPGIPGFQNLTGRVEANQQGGNFSLTSENLTLHFPGYFSESAMVFDVLKMQANWTFLEKQQQLELQIGKMDFVQQGIKGSISGKHTRPLNLQDKASGSIDMTGKLSGFDVKKIGRYLPLQTPEDLRKWLTGALEDGVAQDATFKVKGDLAEFPFADKRDGKRKGEFTVTTRIENGKLNYTPGNYAKDGRSPMWPQAEQIQGTLRVNGARMEIWADTAQTANVALTNVSAIIPDMLSNDRQLEIVGSAAGALQNFVRFTHVTPVAGWIGNFTEDTKGSGNAKLSLKMQMPLTHMMDSKVQGMLQFENNDVNLLKGLPLLSKTKGKLEFYEKGFRLNDINVGFVGGTSVLSGGTQQNGKFQVKASGSLTAEGLRSAFPGLSSRISGSTRYSLAINEKGRQPDILLESNLRGVALDFPAPLKKSAAEAMPFKFQMLGLTPASGTTWRDEIKISLGTALSTRYLRQKAAGKNQPWEVVRGGIGVNVAAPDPATGLAIKVAMDAIDVETWQGVLGSVVGSKKTKTAEQVDALDLSQYLDPDVFSAKTPKLTVSGVQLDRVELIAEPRQGGWQLGLKSDQATGHINWIASGSKQEQEKISARLTSLNISESAASDASEFLAASGKPTRIPTLDIVADNFEIFGKKLGRIELDANNTPGTSGREWKINKLLIANPDATLKASGNWTATRAANVTKMSYSLEMADAGKLLDRFGFTNVLRGGKGKMGGVLQWNAPPFSLDKPSLSGQIDLAMGSGQFLQADPGIAKLLGVLSLQNLPRRLTLDFRDVFSKGFAFDGISATANINAGIIKTDNLKMRGVSALVLMEGSANIVNETQNLHVVVIPVFDISAAAIVYGVAINPVIGAGAFLAQLFLKEPLMKAMTFEYKITGPWSDPTITKLEKAGHAGKTPPAKN